MTSGALHQVLLASAQQRVLTFQTSSSSTVNATIYTFSNLAIGTAAPNRYVIVGAWNSANGAQSLSSLTIGGVSASIVVQANSSGDCADALAIALLTTGTTANIVVTWAAVTEHCGVGVWSALGLSTTAAIGTGTSGASPASISLTTRPGGVAVGLIGQNAGSVYGWTGLTEDFDNGNTVESTGYGGASATTITGNSISVACTYSIADPARQCVAACWW